MGKYEFDFGYGMFCIIKAFGFRKSSLPDKANHLTPKYEEIRFCDKYMVYAEQWLNDYSDDKKTSVQVASDFAQDRDRIIDVVWAFRLHLREKLCGIASEYGDDAGKREKVVKYQSFQLDDSDILEAARSSYSESDLVKFALVADKTLTWLDTIGELVEVVLEDQQGAERVKAGKAKSNTGKDVAYKFFETYINGPDLKYHVLNVGQGKGKRVDVFSELWTMFKGEHPEWIKDKNGLKSKGIVRDSFSTYLSLWRKPTKD